MYVFKTGIMLYKYFMYCKKCYFYLFIFFNPNNTLFAYTLFLKILSDQNMNITLEGCRIGIII